MKSRETPEAGSGAAVVWDARNPTPGRRRRKHGTDAGRSDAASRHLPGAEAELLGKPVSRIVTDQSVVCLDCNIWETEHRRGSSLAGVRWAVSVTQAMLGHQGRAELGFVTRIVGAGGWAGLSSALAVHVVGVYGECVASSQIGTGIMCNVFLLSPEALVAGSRRSDQSSLVVSKSGSSLKPENTVAVAMAPSNTNSRTDRREEHDLRGCTLQDARPIWSYIVHRRLADRDNHEMSASSLHRSCHQQFVPSRRLGSWDGRWNHWSNVEKQEGLVGFERRLNPVSPLSR